MRSIVVNGIEQEAPDGMLTYVRICLLAGFDPKRSPIVGYRFRDSGATGLLSPEDRIMSADGLVLTVEPKRASP